LRFKRFFSFASLVKYFTQTVAKRRGVAKKSLGSAVLGAAQVGPTGWIEVAPFSILHKGLLGKEAVLGGHAGPAKPDKPSSFPATRASKQTYGANATNAGGPFPTRVLAAASPARGSRARAPPGFGRVHSCMQAAASVVRDGASTEMRSPSCGTDPSPPSQARRLSAGSGAAERGVALWLQSCWLCTARGESHIIRQLTW